MIEIKTKLRKWGNSFGIVVPQKAINESGKCKEGDEITIFIKTEKPNLRRLFGAHKFSKTTKKLMEEMDKELYND